MQGDIKTAMAMGAWCHTVLTAVTAQTPERVSHIRALEVNDVLAQLEALFSLGPVFAPQVLKTGMLGNADLIPELAGFLAGHNKPLVVDTVLQATSGASLADEQVPAAFVEHLFPLATVITPNLDEAARLLDCERAEDLDSMREQAQVLCNRGARAVLLKGGHLEGEQVVDILVSAESIREFRSERIASPHTHGSGCALATAIAVGLAQGLALDAAIEQAILLIRKFIQQASTQCFVETNGPLVHFNLQQTGRTESNHEAER